VTLQLAVLPEPLTEQDVGLKPPLCALLVQLETEPVGVFPPVPVTVAVQVAALLRFTGDGQLIDKKGFVLSVKIVCA
jgi:hypothetical protein